MNKDYMIVGGWGYIGTAYGLTWLVLGAYAFSLWIRFRKVRREKGLS